MLAPVGMRCLIVDDSAGFRQAARALLEQEGMTVVGVAATCEDAVRLAIELRPDVTLVDIDLGGSSGCDLARRLADEAGGAAGRVILISAHAEEEFADLIEASPAAGFLPKPALCADAIRDLISGGSAGPGVGGPGAGGSGAGGSEAGGSEAGGSEAGGPGIGGSEAGGPGIGGPGATGPRGTL
jgi:two-component system, NarL family, nitrate/nitrite response regulator NarL